MSAIDTERLATDQTEPRYSLLDSEVRDLSLELLTERPPYINHRFVCYEVDGYDKYSNIGRALETSVFNQTFGDTAETMEYEYGPYEHASTFYIIMDQKERRAAGVMRLIHNSETGIKAFNDLENGYLKLPKQDVVEAYKIDDLDKVIEIATMAIAPEYRHKSRRNANLSLLLHRAYYRKALVKGFEHVVTIIDERAKRGVDLVGIPVKPILNSGPFPYITSENSYALHGRISEGVPALLERSKELRRNKNIKSLMLSRVVGRFATGKGFDDKLMFDVNHKKL